VLQPEAEIVCVDCGGAAYLITLPREDGAWLPGDIVTYRCRDCRDRWDLVLPYDDADEDDADDVELR
jgi:hypothetical protein